MQLAGKYRIISQDNFFEGFLKADGAGMLIRKTLVAANPKMVVEMDGDNFTITSITSLNTIKKSFTLGQAYEYQSEYKMGTYITTREGDTLLTSDVNNPSSTSSMTFIDDVMILTMTTNGVTATRTFSRA
jgi:hypothetical protein